MAIINNNEYYKIDYNRSYVDHCVHVYYDIYASIEDRKKEKSRAPLIQNFLTAVSINKEKLFNGIIAMQIKTEEEWDEQYKNNTAFRTMVDEMNALDYIANNANILFYSINGIHLSYSMPQFIIDFGGYQEWIDDPIAYVSGGITNCGEYHGEPIDYSLYYNALKHIIIGET